MEEEITIKSIRNKMYGLFRAGGRTLTSKEHKEIKALMEAYRNLKIQTTDVKKEALPVSSKTVRKQAGWKPYPTEQSA